jgi:selenide,water dikinase
MIYDPQTSGGLLAAVAREQADDLVDALHAVGVGYACRIGEVMPLAEKDILLRIV